MDLDTRIFHAINDFARDTPWLHAVVSGYANYGTALFAVLMLGTATPKPASRAATR